VRAFSGAADYRTDAMDGKLKGRHYREVLMRRLNSFQCQMGLVVAITAFGTAGLGFSGSATAQERLRLQKQSSPPQFNRFAFHISVRRP
jgi:hypothetical protein